MKITMYMSVSDAANKFNISKRRVQLLCEQGRINGANMVSGVWLIPSTAQKPDDARKKRKILDNQFSLFGVRDTAYGEKISLDQVCEILSISTATAKNWIRLGKLTVEEGGKSFDKKYIEELALEIKNGDDTRLKSRRNKKCLSGNSLYKEYIQNDCNQKTVETILKKCEVLSEEELRVILSFFATQLYCQSRNLAFSKDRFRNADSFPKDLTFSSLRADLLNGIDLARFDYANIEFIFDLSLSFVPTEDTLGFVYISLRDLSKRKQTGAYFTPAKTVRTLISSLLDVCPYHEDMTFCDPCCGTGNFLIGLLEQGVNVDDLYGQDIDEISVLITRLNMFLLHKELCKDELVKHFVCGDTLASTFAHPFSVVLGNPPWGYDFSKEQVTFLCKNYRTAKQKGMESYDLFIEKGVNLLEDDGYIAYVLPEAILSVASHFQVREFVLKTTSFKFIAYLGNVFSGVQCPSIIMGLKKDKKGSTENCRVSSGTTTFRIKADRELDASLFSFNMSDKQFECLKAIQEVSNAVYLANNARFALGIVTGNNKEYIKNSAEFGYEPILKGSDILRYGIKEPSNYIHFMPELFQQVAPTELYRTEEKLLYRFISEVPVFTYDNKQMLSLNSCNILIPQIEGISIKYVLAILNSSVASFYLSQKFNSIKLLRSHIESLPIPIVDERIQNNIVSKVDCLLTTTEDASSLYAEIDKDIFSLYCLSSRNMETIQSTLNGKTTFLK